MPFRSSGRGAYGPQGQRVLRGPLAPVWVTSGSLGSANVGTAISVQLTATDDSGVAPTYTLASGSLPGGTFLSSSGLISGTLNSAGTATFTVRATDENGRFTDSSSLSYTTAQPAWTSLTLTTTSTGRDGPTSTGQVTATFSGSSPTYSLSAGKILLNVPATGTYNFTMAGARGGHTDSNSQLGGQSPIGTVNGVSLSSGQVLEIVIGQIGQSGQQGTSAGGGGGATYVRVQGSGTPIGVSPGGGGGSQNQTGMSTTEWSRGLSGRRENSGSTGGGRGSFGQFVNGTHEGGGAGGWSSNGSWDYGGIPSDGLGIALTGTARGGGGNFPGGDGGFGGGGRGGHGNGAGGGGGGYQGGWGGVYQDPGVGNSGTGGQSGSGGWGFGLSYTGSMNNGAGYITITRV